MFYTDHIFLCGAFLLFTRLAGADVTVPLNINRPINDVSEKFVSFTMDPRDMFKALDSSNRKITTRMASMLGHSYIKFVGDYNFATKTESIRLRNPTKIVWKGFNKWTKGVNWSMIIPVPYKPDQWDPMETLKILNTSQMANIDEAIWQLGTDFGFSRATDYVNELKTFNVMVDSFKPTVANWQAMGADISAGSSPEETRRYIEMSKHLTAAYGWMQSDDKFLGNNIDTSLDRQDPALRVLFESEVPVWLTLPKSKPLPFKMDDEVLEGLRWAQTMGDAANMGFNAIFKPLTFDDMEGPTYSFFVTVLFKKIMGSRVYPARPLSVFSHNNMLYTHCANTVSGGLAFMVMNKQEQPLHIAVKVMNRLQDTEVWQYALTMHDGQVMLNNNILDINSTLVPEVKRKYTRSMLQLKTPGWSVSFWVLPNADLEHCHFKEVETPSVLLDNNKQKIKRYSSSERLLKELIKESTKPSAHSSVFPLVGLMSRHRRSVDNDNRFKRFVLEGNNDEVKPLANLAGNLIEEKKAPFKGDIYSPERKRSALDWLSNIFKQSPLLKRNTRQSNLQMSPSFMTRDGRSTSFTSKTTAIKRPEKNVKKFILEEQEFDEEKFFKNVDVQPDPDYVRIPEEDVYLRNIGLVNGDDPEEELIIETKNYNTGRIPKKEIVSEKKPLGLLPTDDFELMPTKFSTINNNFGSSLNAVLYSDLFDKTYVKSIPPNKAAPRKEIQTNLNVETETASGDHVVQAHIHLSEKANRRAAQKDAQMIGKGVENWLDVNGEIPSENFFVDYTKNDADDSFENDNILMQTNAATAGRSGEIPWWDLLPKRLKRSLNTHYSTDSYRSNMIVKNDGAAAHNYEETVNSNNNNTKDKMYNESSVGRTIVNTFKEQFRTFLRFFSHHANEWYNTLTKKFDGVLGENATTSTAGNSLA